MVQTRIIWTFIYKLTFWVRKKKFNRKGRKISKCFCNSLSYISLAFMACKKVKVSLHSLVFFFILFVFGLICGFAIVYLYGNSSFYSNSMCFDKAIKNDM